MSISASLNFESHAQVQDLETTLATPLIIGASISSDLVTASPGKRLALRYTASKNLKIQAASGQTGERTLARLRKNDFTDRSIVLAVDLLFWDSLRADASGSLKALKALVDTTSKQNLPLVLGDIPELIPGFQPSRDRLNQEIRRMCQADKQCRILPFDRIFRQLMQQGSLQINGRALGIRELLPDGLHLSAAGSEYMANVLQDLINPSKRS